MTWVAIAIVLVLAGDVPEITKSLQHSATDSVETIGHPRFPLLDAAGTHVLRSRGPVSTMRTCGACHDTDYIAGHNYHALAGVDERIPAGEAGSGRAWDTSPGLFGRWDPLLYRYLSPPDDERTDMNRDDWVRAAGARHVGGGPVADSLELNCFLCHIPSPDNAARIAAIRDGAYEWATTATLARTGVVRRTGTGWEWNDRLFDPLGRVWRNEIALGPPGSDNCGLCHGITHNGDEPLRAYPAARDADRATLTTGQVFAAQRMAVSGMNLAGKNNLARPWDVHAERLLDCTSCHFSPNDPAYTARSDDRPAHLSFDARRQDVGEFLRRPDHNLAKGHSAQGTVADELDGGMRACDSCHRAEAAHDWLPYAARHMDRLMCESCHVPRVYAPALRAVDWTVLTRSREPRREFRGVDGEPGDPTALVTGYVPVLMARDDAGDTRVGPHNLVTTWFWTGGDPPRPVRLAELESAFFDGEGWHADVLDALDTDADGTLSEDELVLRDATTVEEIAARLRAVGVTDPTIRGEVQPYGVHHGVAPGAWATRRCETCHADDSAMDAPAVLARLAPPGVTPRFVGDSTARPLGDVVRGPDGSVVYTPALERDGFYVLGNDRWRAGDALGAIAIAIAMTAAALHGALRFVAARRRKSA